MAQTPTRTVLYTCGANEEFFCYEYYSNMKVLGNKFACVTKNKDTSKRTLVVNGVPVVSALQLDVFWVDPVSKNKCIYMYSNSEQEVYLFIDGRTYGPYEDINYDQYACKYYWNGAPNYDIKYNRNRFYFKRMGKVFRHDNDGSIHECIGTSVWGAKEDNPVYRSASGKHRAEFSNNYRMLNVDGVTYVMPIDVDAETVYLREMVVTEEGDCIIEFAFNAGSEWSYPYFVVANNSIQYIKDGEYFDPSSRKVKKYNQSATSKRPRQMESYMRWKDGSWVNAVDISLQDKSNRHFFTANWNYDYVMIDDKKIKTSTPINAFYDSSNNAFGWVTIEGRQLVLYSYKLPA